jgi:hypothetical protein
MTINGDIFMTSLLYHLTYQYIRDFLAVKENEALNTFCLGHFFLSDVFFIQQVSYKQTRFV